MGKVHRIKKAFWKAVSQEPRALGYHYVPFTGASFYVGKRNDGSSYILSYHAYAPLLKSLIAEYEKTKQVTG